MSDTDIVDIRVSSSSNWDEDEEEDGEKETMTREQLAIYDAVMQGKNVYFEGEAGTGKSFVLRSVIESLKKIYPHPAAVGVTASTGISALAMNGRTLHNWAKMGLIDKTVKTVAAMARSANLYAKHIKLTKVLIIEEISMISADVLDTLDEVLQKIRKNMRTFGGIQLVVCGDFHQLPPVTKSGQERKYAFEAKCWQTFRETRMRLTRVFRQQDQQFVDILRQVRNSTLTEDTIKLLRSKVRPLSAIQAVDGIEPTIMYCTKARADELNSANLRKIVGPSKIYKATDTSAAGEDGKRALSAIQNDCQSPAHLELKVGAQVMLTKNIDLERKLCNGSRGVVVSIDGDYPRVRFQHGVTCRVSPEEWEQTDPGNDRFILAKRSQLPLALAWAITVHKSQGLQFKHMVADLANAFEYGQVYVALSRACSLEGLHLLSFNPINIKTDPKVVAFYASFDADIAKQTKSVVPELSISRFFTPEAKRQRV